MNKIRNCAISWDQIIKTCITIIDCVLRVEVLQEKMGVDKLINQSFNILNEMINKESGLTVRSVNLSNESLETLKLVENCISCKDNVREYFDRFHKSINEMEFTLTELEKAEQGKD